MTRRGGRGASRRSEPAYAIEARELTKTYGKRPALRRVNLRVGRGEVFALVGPNGAGKTTLIRLLCGLAYPSAGGVRLLGYDPFKHAGIRRKLGAVVEAPAAFYPYLSAKANLELHGRLAGGLRRGRVREVLEMVELEADAERSVGLYSLGMRQRLGVAAALLTDPEMLILDEPASGVDPLSLHLIHRILRRAAAEGAAVLLSTHHLDEVVAYCSKVAILEEGVLIDEISLVERQGRYRARVSDPARARLALQTQPFIRSVRPQGGDILFVLSEPSALGHVAAALVAAGVELHGLSPDSFDLRAYYRERVEAETFKTHFGGPAR